MFCLKPAPREKKALLDLLEEKDRRWRRLKLLTFYPDSGPLRRDLYQKHLEFFKAGHGIPNAALWRPIG